MKKSLIQRRVPWIPVALLSLALCSCGGGGGGTTTPSGSYVADYRVATDAVLRAIPESYIDSARSSFHVAYFHTSHGTHVSYGVFGLPGFKLGDSDRFGVTLNAATPDPDKLDFRDNETTGTYADLSEADDNWAAWRDQVRSYLNDPDHAHINVMLWSWCDITGHDVNQYLSSMQTLINEYGPGSGRPTPVTFIFMTGHAKADANTGVGNPSPQAALITDYCETHGYYCIDYYSIDTHAMNGTYYQDAGDNGYSAAYGGNFYADWQADHAEHADWYRNLDGPGGSESCGEHIDSQHITANRKAFAFWWVLARMAGYEG